MPNRWIRLHTELPCRCIIIPTVTMANCPSPTPPAMLDSRDGLSRGGLDRSQGLAAYRSRPEKLLPHSNSPSFAHLDLHQPCRSSQEPSSVIWPAQFPTAVGRAVQDHPTSCVQAALIATQSSTSPKVPQAQRGADPRAMMVSTQRGRAGNAIRSELHPATQLRISPLRRMGIF